MSSRTLLASGEWSSHSEPEWLLSPDEPLPLAAHITTARLGYTHHGIYVGDGKVVHYVGLSRRLRRGPIEEVSLSKFSGGRPIEVRPHPQRRFSDDEVLARARSRLGEDRYRILSNNCEHLCEWCTVGDSRSRQVERWRMRARSILQSLHPAIGIAQIIAGAAHASLFGSQNKIAD